MSQYAIEFMRLVEERNPGQPEFVQAVGEVVESVAAVLDRHPEYRTEKILDRMVEPERVIMFRVPWMDDNDEYQVNRGYRIEFDENGDTLNKQITLFTVKGAEFVVAE